MPPPERAGRDSPVGQVDALAVPRFAGLRSFARLPTLETLERAEVAVLGAPRSGGDP
jgi:agmatinase